MPVFTVVAGPHGSGKSTITKEYDFEGEENILDPDAIAKRMDPENPARRGVEAGRKFFRGGRNTYRGKNLSQSKPRSREAGCSA